jgi:HlyD family secretion protein
MDFKRDNSVQNKLSISRKYWYVPVLVFAVLAAFYVKSNLGDASYFVSRDEIQTAAVQYGDFQVNIRATGVLKPTDMRWVSSRVAGKVEQILVKPGTQVQVGEKLMILTNPELEIELEKIRWQVKATKADNIASDIELESELLALENEVTDAKFAYESAKLKLDAENELLLQGNSALSKIDYERSKLDTQRHVQRWKAQEQRLKKMKENLQAKRAANEAKLGQVENDLSRVERQVDNLSIVASITGVVQKVPVLLGQQSEIGSNMALIADPASLIAELKVQELQVRDVVLGQKVTIDTRNSETVGEVIRIDPAVEDGMVQIDVRLPKDLPSEVRPDLNVDGSIEVAKIADTMHVKRPAFAPRNRQVELYRLSADKGFAQKLPVMLGTNSVNEVQVVSGLQRGDVIVISDTSSWSQHSEVKIN